MPISEKDKTTLRNLIEKVPHGTGRWTANPLTCLRAGWLIDEAPERPRARSIEIKVIGEPGEQAALTDLVEWLLNHATEIAGSPLAHWEIHHPECGETQRGCSQFCPKDHQEKTGQWLPELTLIKTIPPQDIDVYQLREGDIFTEDGHSARYQAICFFGSRLIARCIEDGTEASFGYTQPAYAPILFKIGHIDAHRKSHP